MIYFYLKNQDFGIWHSVAGPVVSDIFKDHLAFIFRVIDLNLYQHDFENFKHYTFLPVISNCWFMYTYVLLGTVYKVSLQKTHAELSHVTLYVEGFSGLVVSMLASGTQVCGFKPDRSRRIFTGIKILSMPSSGEEVKESVPCPSFAACKRT